MRQLLYVSDSRIGTDTLALDRLMLQARHNNALDGITGLLWTDGRRFAQVLEGEEALIAELVAKLRTDERHANFEIVQDGSTDERRFGEWSMNRPDIDAAAQVYEQRMRRQLASVGTALTHAYEQVIGGSRTAMAG